ncbi:MurR/RpiR family transcriptional regulator [Peribacillus frigoritolerans]|jgi:DNA-binding MurR/RpiR family transcriptional regulator|uniref:MurR/RpiR family transcriptional regulator n=1 Tax=Peribacillus TaxID=2675229 RepID=UPI0007BFC8F3|nr:MurR/RpiR family transcriptional regulator [Peribacillus frigoritolerans]PHD73529.1 MurR/RpiR family transcriptional regulator [Bacillus sp. AFS043905]QNK48957.1 MurR/RpiR family transcriptional regulator [Brevibacterium sp. PAMC23299]MCU6603343.1 MurR/RpiR family transcriptional regulator [Peribacillus frigoritolerans]MCY9003038.1 MurR/RpiR family transcriptional regulator [Peribacillus frigoritolerans]TWE03288.1 RpiR family transcriptional regulator [Peribacillus frigoritolerans]
MENPILKLKNKISELTETQKRVADYIIKNPVDVAFLTVDQLAGIVGTSTTTIMRLTFSLNYSGYTEFQKGLQELLRNRAAPQIRLEANLKDLNESDLWIRSAESQLNNIQSTVEMISTESLNKTVEMIVSADRIFCTSVRSGLPVAQHLTFGLNRLLGNCELIVADLSDWVDKGINFTSKDLVIATSFPRYARRIVEFAMAAKDNNAQIISITDSYSSPLVKYSDLVLPCNSSSIAFHNSPIASMLVADYLVSAIAINYPEKTKNRLDEINSILTKMNYHYSD